MTDTDKADEEAVDEPRIAVGSVIRAEATVVHTGSVARAAERCVLDRSGCSI